MSPVLANLFMHYAFDAWMAQRFPGIPFERYADDAVVHCVSQQQAQAIRAAIENRMVEVGLRLHPDKTRIVYCKDSNRRGSHEHTSFTFLGFTFRARKARSRHGKNFAAFLPAISKDALKKISQAVRSWRLHRRVGHTFAEMARDQPDRARLDAVLRSVLPLRAASPPPTHQRLPDALDPQEVQTVTRVQEGQDLLGGDHRKVSPPVRSLALDPRLLGTRGDKSRVTGDCHARICGSREVKFLPATRPVGPLPF
ncbi:reverse transcriptase domain-containing protein [Phytohabitans houttuyneae]|uniref:reverse transcriptase domain-containing protein n=1 Tax=Phytohabitans houttuyneae TaxID=1076126 RepID=UPI0024839A4E